MIEMVQQASHGESMGGFQPAKLIWWAMTEIDRATRYVFEGKPFRSGFSRERFTAGVSLQKNQNAVQSYHEVSKYIQEKCQFSTITSQKLFLYLFFFWGGGKRLLTLFLCNVFGHVQTVCHLFR